MDDEIQKFANPHIEKYLRGDLRALMAGATVLVWEGYAPEGAKLPYAYAYPDLAFNDMLVRVQSTEVGAEILLTRVVVSCCSVQ